MWEFINHFKVSNTNLTQVANVGVKTINPQKHKGSQKKLDSESIFEISNEITTPVLCLLISTSRL